MKKLLVFAVLLCFAFALFGCAKVDESLAVGSVISQSQETPSNQTTEAVTTKPKQEKSNSQTVSGNGGSGNYDDYQSSYGGGDSGGGVATFSNGSIPNLPDINLGKAQVITHEEIKLFEGQKLTLSDKKLESAVNIAKARLNADKKFSEFSMLIASTEQVLSDGNVTLKLNKSYADKIAYMYFMDKNGDIVDLNPNSDKDYISYVLDSNNFANNQLKLNFFNRIGTYIILFGAK